MGSHKEINSETTHRGILYFSKHFLLTLKISVKGGYLNFFLNIYLFIFRERRREGEQDEEKH